MLLALDAQRLDPSGGAAKVLPLQRAGSSQTGSIKLAGEADLRAHFSNPEIQFLEGVNWRDIQWWNQTLIQPHGLTPKELRDVLLRGADQYLTVSNVVTTCRIMKNLGWKFVNVKIVLYGDNPHEAASWMDLDLHLKGQRLTIQSVQVNDAGKGMGTVLSSNMEGLARNVGCTEVFVFAAKAAGPYFWARRGYVPTQDDWTESVAPKIQNCLGELFTASKISAEVKTNVEEILEDKNAEAITRIAALREPMIASSRDPDARIPLGRALLAESGIAYNASLRL